MSFWRRPATSDDDEFLLRLYAATRTDLDGVGLAPEQKEALLRLQFNARRQQYAFAFPAAEDSVVMVDEVPVGRILINRAAGEYRLIDIALLPEFRGHAIGTGLIRELLAEAFGNQAVVKLRVKKDNPALRLYQRLGFSICDDEQVDVEMERQFK